MEKEFNIGIVLSVTHSRLLTKMENCYKILNFMLKENLFTHQLPRAADFCRPFILAQYPNLSEWDSYNELINTDNWKGYIKIAENLFGKTLPIKEVPGSIWNHKEPMQELSEMVDKDKIIQINTSKEPEFNNN